VAGRYHIIREIGRGAMGRVYLARDSVLEREVALKELAVPDYLEEEEKRDVRERFTLEAKAAAKLTHPYILTVHDIIASGDRQLIVMEYLEGKTLRDILKERMLSPEEVMSIAPMICEALGYAHARGVIHRDVKPDNIFVLQNGNIKVADFGIAKMLKVSDRTHTDVIMGTPNYIAPEVVRGMPFDHRVDIFALGVTIYEMLTGRRPFEAGNDYAVIFKVASEEPFPLGELRKDLPARLVHSVNRAIQKDPERRYRSMEEFKQDLIKVRVELGMATQDMEVEKAFDKESALRSELVEARRVDVEAEAGEEIRGYDFRRDKEWKELIARVYRSEPAEEEAGGKGAAAAPAGGRRDPLLGAGSGKAEQAGAASGRGYARRSGVPRAAGMGAVPGVTGGALAQPAYVPFGVPTRREEERREGATRFGIAAGSFALLLIVATLFPWLGKGLNPARSLLGISFAEGIALACLATAILGCDALLFVGAGPSAMWTKSMRVFSVLCILVSALFLALRVLGGVGYERAPDITLGGALAGTGWGFWVAFAASLAVFWCCSRVAESMR